MGRRSPPSPAIRHPGRGTPLLTARLLGGPRLELLPFLSCRGTGGQGIWRPIYLEYWQDLRLARAYTKVMPLNTAGSYYPVDTTAELYWAGASAVAATVTIRLDETGLSISTPITLVPGAQDVTATLSVPTNTIQTWCAPATDPL